MYKVACQDLRTVSKAIYQFMTNPSLIRPECTIWHRNGMPSTIANGGTSFMSEKDLFRRIIQAAAAAISCVAATDLGDTRRVVLTYTPGLDFMVLSFPQSNGRLSSAERKIVEDMRDWNELYS